MYKFKIDKIVVNTTDGPTDIVPKKINVLVGPNNSGKSRFLKESRNYLFHYLEVPLIIDNSYLLT